MGESTKKISFYFSKIDAAKFFHPGLWASFPEAQKARYKEQVRMMNKYAEIRNSIIQICGNDKLIQIIEGESEDYSRRLAFMETTREELLSGADYSKCETIDDIAEVYSASLLRRLGF